MTGIKISEVVLVMAFAMKQSSSYTETCVGEFCFTTPGASELRNFDGAKSWCTDINSALVVLNTSDAQQALTQFLKSSNMNSAMFINIKLSQHGLTWFLVNGSRYDGAIGNQGPDEYKLYCFLNPAVNHFQVDALQPYESNRYICEFQDLRCLNASPNNILYNGKCYIKYENESLTWYQARERCYNSGGDLASFQSDPSNLWGPQFDTSWLNISLTYWVGIRWNDWRWNTPDGGNEGIYISWSSGKPNNYSYQCVCIDPNGNPAWSWTDCDCGQTRQFVCLRTVPTTTTLTTRTTATRSPSIQPNATGEAISDSNPNSTKNAIILGLVLGIILPLIIVIIVLIIIIIHLRRQSRNNPRCSKCASAAANATTIQPVRSATESDATTIDPHYQSLEKDVTPALAMQLYEPLN